MNEMSECHIQLEPIQCRSQPWYRYILAGPIGELADHVFGKNKKNDSSKI